MVEFSREQATPGDIASGYSDEGYTEVFKDPAEMYDEMSKSGVTVDSSEKLSSSIKKQQAPNPRLLREKRLKILFLQYINKYLSNPKKFIDHPKQIKRLPSWFDDAIVLFKDIELSRYQKKMIREFFYGLIQYRDNRMVTEKYGGVDTDEVNRQLGMRSPYAETIENIDEQSFPRQRDLKEQIDVRGLMGDTRSMDITRKTPEMPYDDYMGVDPDTPPMPVYTTNKNKTNIGPLGLGRSNPSNATVNDYVMFNKREQLMPGDIQSNPVQAPVKTNVTPVAKVVKEQNPITTKSPGSGKSAGTGAFGAGKSMLGGLFGNMNRSQMIGAVGLPQPKLVPTPTVVNQPVQRKRKPIKAKMVRKQPIATMNKRSSDALTKMFDNIKKVKNASKISTSNVKNMLDKKAKKAKTMNVQKASYGLQTIRNMDKLFGQIKSVSSNTFGRQNMKMKIVTDIKDQCGRAFDKNKFRQESVNMKKNYFNDIKNSYPQMKMDIEEMGDIKENRMMHRSMNDVPQIINSRRTTNSLMIGRGDMRPKSMGIIDYDFSIEPLTNKRKSKRIEFLDDDDFVER